MPRLFLLSHSRPLNRNFCLDFPSGGGLKETPVPLARLKYNQTVISSSSSHQWWSCLALPSAQCLVCFPMFSRFSWADLVGLMSYTINPIIHTHTHKFYFQCNTNRFSVLFPFPPRHVKEKRAAAVSLLRAETSQFVVCSMCARLLRSSRGLLPIQCFFANERIFTLLAIFPRAVIS